MNTPREIPDPVFAENDHNLGTDLDEPKSFDNQDDERLDPPDDE